eukprot:1190413-Prorocentrum_minimum.AAC.3
MDQSDAGGAGIFPRWTNQTQKARSVVAMAIDELDGHVCKLRHIQAKPETRCGEVYKRGHQAHRWPWPRLTKTQEPKDWAVGVEPELLVTYNPTPESTFGH